MREDGFISMEGANGHAEGLRAYRKFLYPFVHIATKLLKICTPFFDDFSG